MMEYLLNVSGMSERIFLLPHQRGRLLFVDEVLQHIYQHAQTRFWQREAGGQLFSPAPQSSTVVVSVATGPHSKDIRSRHHFVPNLLMATRDRKIQFDVGHHAVGLWHTHPEDDPKPSGQDYTTTRQYLEALQGTMEGFILVILGKSGNPLNMAVWMAATIPFGTWIKLEEI